MRVTKSKLQNIIKEEAQTLLRERKQHRPESTIKQDIAYARAAIADLQDQMKIALDTPGHLGSVRYYDREDEIENIKKHIRNFEMELKPYHIKKEFNDMLVKQYTAAADYDPLLDPHGVDLGIEQSMGMLPWEKFEYPPDLQQAYDVVPTNIGQPHSEWMEEWAFNKARKKEVESTMIGQIWDAFLKKNPNFFDPPEEKKLPYVHYSNEPYGF